MTKTTEENKRHRKENKNFIDNYKKAQGCVMCGKKTTLTFHHNKKEKKSFNIATKTSYSRKRLKEEIKKCVVLCKNCHEKVHVNDHKLREWENVPSDISKYQGFVYLITNTVNNKYYVGKKFFWSKNKVKKAKTKTKEEIDRLTKYSIELSKAKKNRKVKSRVSDHEKKIIVKISDYKKKIKKRLSSTRFKKKVVIKESDWKTYVGSSNNLKKDIDRYGKHSFRREILKCCDSKFDCAYDELLEQVRRDVLSDSLSYNEIINVRLRKRK